MSPWQSTCRHGMCYRKCGCLKCAIGRVGSELSWMWLANVWDGCSFPWRPPVSRIEAGGGFMSRMLWSAHWIRSVLHIRCSFKQHSSSFATGRIGHLYEFFKHLNNVFSLWTWMLSGWDERGMYIWVVYAFLGTVCFDRIVLESLSRIFFILWSCIPSSVLWSGIWQKFILVLVVCN